MDKQGNMKLTDANRPLRVFDRVLRGGLGAGNLGVVMSRHGTGKTAVLTSIAIDHAMAGVHTLHVATGKSVEDVRAYDDEVLHEMIECYGIQDTARVMTRVERHKQIYTYRDGDLTSERLRGTLEFLANHADFRPGLIELETWPNFETVNEAEIQALKQIAVDFETEIWMTAHAHRTDSLDDSGVPQHIARFDDLVSVLVALEPVSDHVLIRFVKTHDVTPPEGVHLEFDPNTMLIRWR